MDKYDEEMLDKIALWNFTNEQITNFKALVRLMEIMGLRVNNVCISEDTLSLLRCILFLMENT